MARTRPPTWASTAIRSSAAPHVLHLEAETGGDASSDTVTLRNTTDQPILISHTIQTPHHRPVGDFNVAPPSSIAPGAASAVLVAFHPLATQPDDNEHVTHRTAKVTMSDDHKIVGAFRLRGKATPPPDAEPEDSHGDDEPKKPKAGGAPRPVTFDDMASLLASAGSLIQADNYDMAIPLLDAVVTELDHRANDVAVLKAFHDGGFNEGQSADALDDIATARGSAEEMYDKAKFGSTINVDHDTTGFSSGREALRFVLGETKDAPSYRQRAHNAFVEGLAEDATSIPFWAGFISGVADGVLDGAESILRAVPQLVEHVLFNALTGVIGMAKDTYDTIASVLSVPGALEKAGSTIEKGWKLDDDFDRGEFRGRLVGYVGGVMVAARMLGEAAEEMLKALDGVFARFARQFAAVREGEMGVAGASSTGGGTGAPPGGSPPDAPVPPSSESVEPTNAASQKAPEPSAAEAARSGPDDAKPTQRVRRPGDRHYLNKVDQSTLAKPLNTVIEPRVDVAADVAEINAGNAQPARGPNGEKAYTVNGRTYGVHDDGRLFPISGDGFITLSRRAYKVLQILNEFGETDFAMEIIGKQKASPEDIEAARAAWRSGR